MIRRILLQLPGYNAAPSLERRTVNQTMSSTDLRYQMVMDNLATAAANDGALPSFGVISDGLTTVTDSAKFDVKYSQLSPAAT